MLTMLTKTLAVLEGNCRSIAFPLAFCLHQRDKTGGVA